MSYVSNWYPRKLDESGVIRKIVKEAILEGYNAKSISAYFNQSLYFVYSKVSIKKLTQARRVKRMKEKLEQKFSEKRTFK